MEGGANRRFSGHWLMSDHSLCSLEDMKATKATLSLEMFLAFFVFVSLFGHFIECSNKRKFILQTLKTNKNAPQSWSFLGLCQRNPSQKNQKYSLEAQSTFDFLFLENKAQPNFFSINENKTKLNGQSCARILWTLVQVYFNESRISEDSFQWQAPKFRRLRSDLVLLAV